MDDELKKLVEIAAKNSEDIKKDLGEMKKMVKSIKNHFFRDEMYSLLKFLLIIVPLVLGAIYLMPFLQQSMQQYQQLMGFATETSNGTVKIEDLKKMVSPEMLKQLESLGQKNQ